jgi:hypothetical protein
MLIAGDTLTLREYLFINDLNLSQFAEIVGCNRVYLSKIFHGKTRPGRILAKSIEKHTGGKVKAVDLLYGDEKNEHSQ